MSEKTFSYYQYRKNLGYPIYIRFEEAEFEKAFVEVLGILGFDPVPRDEIKNVELNPKRTKILRVIKSNTRISKKISAPQLGDSRFGAEQVSNVGSFTVYCYQHVAMLVFSEATLMWELGVKDINDQKALRIVFTRYLSFALATQNIVGFWGVPIEQGIVILSPKEANFETVFVDLDRSKLLTYEGEKNLDADCQVLRLDSMLQTEMRQMKPEQLLSFLSQRTSLITPVGIQAKMRGIIWELSQLLVGYTYPESKFQSREDAAA